MLKISNLLYGTNHGWYYGRYGNTGTVGTVINSFGTQVPTDCHIINL